MSHKDPIPLTIAGEGDVVAYACGKCHHVVASTKMHGEQAEDMARRHCGPWTCSKCGASHDRSYQPTCRPCFEAGRQLALAEQEGRRFAAATKIDGKEYTGPVYCSDVDHNEGFFADLGDLADACGDLEVEIPKYVWACTTRRLQVCLGDVRELALDDHYEGCELRAEDKLGAFLEEWNKEQTGETWYPDYSRAVVLGGK